MNVYREQTSYIAIEKCPNFINHTPYAYLSVLSKIFQNNEAKINHKCKIYLSR